MLTHSDMLQKTEHMTFPTSDNDTCRSE